MTELEKILYTFRNIPRDGERQEDKIKEMDNISPREETLNAICNMRELLDYMEKKITGKLSSEDEENIRNKIRQWEKSINILKMRFLL